MAAGGVGERSEVTVRRGNAGHVDDERQRGGGVNPEPRVGIPRAREELFAAHLLGTTGFAAQTIALAFRAACAAAEAALLELGRAPEPEPAAVVAAFVRHVVTERGLAPDAGRLLRSLHNRAELAQADGAVPAGEGPAAISDATSVVDVVDEWLKHSDYVAIARGEGQPTRPRPPRRKR